MMGLALLRYFGRCAYAVGLGVGVTAAVAGEWDWRTPVVAGLLLGFGAVAGWKVDE